MQPRRDHLAGQARQSAASREPDHTAVIEREVQGPADPQVVERPFAHVQEEPADGRRGAVCSRPAAVSASAPPPPERHLVPPTDRRR